MFRCGGFYHDGIFFLFKIIDFGEILGDLISICFLFCFSKVSFLGG
jgi:hypothetical protein